MDQFFELVRTVTSVGILVGSIIALLMYKQTRSQNKASINTLKREKALEYSLTKNQRYQTARLTLEKEFRGNFSNGSPVALTALEESEFLDQASYLFSHWETMAMSIRHDIVDEEIAYDMVGLTLYNTNRVFTEFIAERRRNNIRRYENLEWLVERWESKLTESGILQTNTLCTRPINN